MLKSMFLALLVVLSANVATAQYGNNNTHNNVPNVNDGVIDGGAEVIVVQRNNQVVRRVIQIVDNNGRRLNQTFVAFRVNGRVQLARELTANVRVKLLDGTWVVRRVFVGHEIVRDGDVINAFNNRQVAVRVRFSL